MVSHRKAQAGAVPVALVIVIGLAVVGAAALYFWIRMPRAAEQPPVLTEGAKAYVRAGSLRLSDVSMGAKESFAKQTLVEITGNIANAGNRTVSLVEIVCVFQDVSGQVVFRERRPIVRSPLKPGESRAFRLAFDTLPESWNQALPQLVIAQIVFA